MKLLYSQMSDKEKEKYRSWHPDCAICGHVARSIDHDHETDVVRGALCQRCNSRIGSLECALRLPKGRGFQSLAGDLHRAYAQTRTMDLSRFTDDFPYLGITEGEFIHRLAAMHAQLTRRFIYWTEITSVPLRSDAVWHKVGPLTEEQAQQALSRLQDPANVPPHLQITMTLEPDDGIDSPVPRTLGFGYHTPGALQHRIELRRSEESSIELSADFQKKCEAYVRDVVPILLSRALTAAQINAADAWLKSVPKNKNELRDAIGDWYSPRWVDLAVRIALEDLGDNLPDPRWASFTRARFHWQKLCTYWNAHHRGTRVPAPEVR